MRQVVAVLVISIFMCLSSRAQRADKHANFPAAVGVSFPVRTYSETVDSIRQIDFKNRSFRLFGEKVRLKNGFDHHVGTIEDTDAGTLYEIRLEKVIYFGDYSGEPQIALVAFDFFAAAGSSSDDGIILVFTLSDHHLKLLQELTYDRQAEGTGDSFNPRSGILTIKARADDDSAHCCPQYLEAARFKWNGTKFELRSRKISELPKISN